HVSAHRSLRDAIDAVTEAGVLRTVELADDIGRRLLGRPARIAVAGLNPHAGEHGILGEEDERFIRPAVAQARAQGIDTDGPSPWPGANGPTRRTPAFPARSPSRWPATGS